MKLRLTTSAILIFLALALCTSAGAVERKQQTPASAKSFLRSLLLPGFSQWEQQRTGAAIGFAATEVALITSVFAIRNYSDWLEQDYRSIAAIHAGIPNGGDRGHRYYVDIGNWNSYEEYNIARQRDREFERQYTAQQDLWRWDNSDNRVHFKQLRLKSDRARESLKFVAGAIVVNHVLSAIDAARFTQNHPSVKLSAVPTSNGIALSAIW